MLDCSECYQEHYIELDDWSVELNTPGGLHTWDPISTALHISALHSLSIIANLDTDGKIFIAL